MCCEPVGRGDSRYQDHHCKNFTILSLAAITLFVIGIVGVSGAISSMSVPGSAVPLAVGVGLGVAAIIQLVKASKVMP